MKEGKVMENYQLIIIIGSNLAIFLTFMGAIIALHIHGNKRVDIFQKEMREETKDFHARLCLIEERRK